jgi:tetrahydromethanopterin S-methyltransferase subunit F
MIEGQMRNAEALHNDIRYRSLLLKSDSTADATLYWITGVALGAFLIAGTLVYRDAALDGRVASNSAQLVSVAATSGSGEQPPMHAHVEGIDP